MFSLIIFDDTDWEVNQPQKCHKVGLRNCVSIQENVLGISGGISITTYTVKFKDGTDIEIRNTVAVFE